MNLTCTVQGKVLTPERRQPELKFCTENLRIGLTFALNLQSAPTIFEAHLIYCMSSRDSPRGFPATKICLVGGVKLKDSITSIGSSSLLDNVPFLGSTP